MAPTSSVMSRIRMFEQQASANDTSGSSGNNSNFQQRGNTRGERSWPPQTDTASKKNTVGIDTKAEKSSFTQKTQKKAPAFLSHFQKPVTDAETRHDSSTVPSPGSPSQESARNGSPKRKSFQMRGSPNAPLSQSPMKMNASKVSQPSWMKQKSGASREVLVARSIETAAPNSTPLKGSNTPAKKDEAKNPKTPDENDAPATEGAPVNWLSGEAKSPTTPGTVAAKNGNPTLSNSGKNNQAEAEQEAPFEENEDQELANALENQAPLKFSSLETESENNMVAEEEETLKHLTPDASAPLEEKLGWPSPEMEYQKAEGDLASLEEMPLKSAAPEMMEPPKDELAWPSPDSEKQVPEPTQTLQDDMKTGHSALESKSLTSGVAPVEEVIPDLKSSLMIETNTAEEQYVASDNEPTPPLSFLSDTASTPRARSNRMVKLRNHGQARSTANNDPVGANVTMKTRYPNHSLPAKTNLKRNLESASVVMEEERVSSIASGSSSQRSCLSTEELSSIAMRAYNASKNPQRKDKIAIGAKMKSTKNAPPKRIQHSNNAYDGDDVSTVGSDSTSHTRSSSRSARFSTLQSRTMSPAPSIESAGDDVATHHSTRSRSSTRSARLHTLTKRNQAKNRSHAPPKEIEANDASTMTSDAVPHSLSNARSSRLSTVQQDRARSPLSRMPAEVDDASTVATDATPYSRSSSRSNRMSTLQSVNRSRSRSPAPLKPREAVNSSTKGFVTSSQPRSTSPSVQNATVAQDSQHLPSRGKNTPTAAGVSNAVSTARPLSRASRRASRMAMLSSSMNRTKSGSPVQWTDAKTNEIQPSRSDSTTAALRQTRSESSAPNDSAVANVKLQTAKSIASATHIEPEAGPSKDKKQRKNSNPPKEENRKETKTQEADDSLSVASDGTSQSLRNHRSKSRKQALGNNSAVLKRTHRSPSPGRRPQRPSEKLPMAPSDADVGNKSVTSVESSKFKSIGSAFKTAHRPQSPARFSEKSLPPSNSVSKPQKTSTSGPTSSDSHQQVYSGGHPQVRRGAQGAHLTPESGSKNTITTSSNSDVVFRDNPPKHQSKQGNNREAAHTANVAQKPSEKGNQTIVSAFSAFPEETFRGPHQLESKLQDPVGVPKIEQQNLAVDEVPEVQPFTTSGEQKPSTPQIQFKHGTAESKVKERSHHKTNGEHSKPKEVSTVSPFQVEHSRMSHKNKANTQNRKKEAQTEKNEKADVDGNSLGHHSANSGEQESSTFLGPAHVAPGPEDNSRVRFDSDPSMTFGQAHVGSLEDSIDTETFRGTKINGVQDDVRIEAHASNSVSASSSTDTEGFYPGKLEALPNSTKDENRSQLSFATTSQTTGSTSSTPNALEWWQKNYAFTQDQNVNEVVKKALTPGTSSGPVAHSKVTEQQSLQPLTLQADGEDLDDIFSGLDDDATASEPEDDAENTKNLRLCEDTEVTSSQMGTLENNSTGSFGDDVFSGVAQSTNSNTSETEYSTSSRKKPTTEQKPFYRNPVKAPPPPPPKTDSDDPSGAILDGSAVMDTVNSDITSSVLGGEPSPWEPTDWTRPPKEERLDVVEEEIDGDYQSDHFSKEDVHSHNNDTLPSKSKKPVDDSSFMQSSRNTSDAAKAVEVKDITDNEGEDINAGTPSSPQNGSLFMNFGWGIFETFANGLCRGPGQDLGTNSMEEVDEQDNDSDLEEETHLDVESIAGSYTSQTVTTMHTIGSVTSAASATLTDKERRVWEAWERRDSQTENAKNVSLLSPTKGRDDLTPEKKQQAASHPERRAAAREKLLGYANSALKAPILEKPGGESIEESSTSYTGESSSLHTADTCSETEEADENTGTKEDESEHKIADGHESNAVLPPHPTHKQNTPQISDPELSFNQRRILEHFSSRLKNEGLEVLKLSRDKKWQLRYLTVSKEVTWLNTENCAPGDRGQCPRGILWLKKFNSKSKDHSISSIDKQGHGGVLCLQLQKVSAAGRGDPQFPLSKKNKARFANSAAINVECAIGGASRSIIFLCQSTDEAHFLCAGMRVVIDVLKRESSTAIGEVPSGEGAVVDTASMNANALEI